MIFLYFLSLFFYYSSLLLFCCIATVPVPSFQFALGVRVSRTRCSGFLCFPHRPPPHRILFFLLPFCSFSRPFFSSIRPPSRLCPLPSISLHTLLLQLFRPFLFLDLSTFVPFIVIYEGVSQFSSGHTLCTLPAGFYIYLRARRLLCAIFSLFLPQMGSHKSSACERRFSKLVVRFNDDSCGFWKSSIITSSKFKELYLYPKEKCDL